MAKMTARFDMVDKVSKKLKILTGNLEGVNKRKRALEKPINIRLRDDASKRLRSIGNQAERVARNRSITVSMNDKFTRRAAGINKYMKRNLPTAWAIAIEAKNRTKSVLENIRRNMNRHLAKPRYLMIEAKDKATRVIHSVSNYARRSLAKGYNFSVRAIDIASKTVGRISSYAGSALPRYRDFSIRAFDRATSVIGSVKRALFSVPTVIGVTLAVVGINNLKQSTVGAAMNFEDYGVSMDHWLKGNKKASAELMDWMGKKADKTPFSSPDIFPAMTGAVALAGDNLKDIKRLTSTAIDMAALTPGRSVEDAMQAITMAKMGNTVMMKGFGLNITKKEMDGLGWDGFVDKIEASFAGGAEKLSKTSSGILATLKGYRGSMMRTLGQGFLDPMKPRLNAINKWLDENQDKWAAWKKAVKTMGTDASEWVFSKLEKGFMHIQHNYLENDAFKKLDFEGKVKFIMDDLGKWWDKTGRPLMVQVSKDVGSAVFDGIVWGVKEGIKGVGGLWGEAFKDPSVGNFGAAMLGTALAGSIATMILSPFTKGIGQLYKGGKWFWGKGKKVADVFKGKGSNSRGPASPVNAGRQPTRTPRNPSTSRRPVYTQPWFGKGQRVDLPSPNDFKNASKMGRLLKALPKLPYLGTALNGVALATASEGERAGAAGGLAGGIAGGTVGAALGTMLLPGVGTIVGGMIGNSLGTMGGSAVGEWLGDNWKDIKKKAAEAGGWITDAFISAKDSISDTLFSGDWWSKQWAGIQSYMAPVIQDTNDWWEGIKKSASETLFSSSWWGGKWDSVKEWTSKKLSDTGDWWEGVQKTASETIFSAGWWAYQAGYLYGYLEETIFSGEWWGQQWEAVLGWTEGTIFDAGWWSSKWGSVQEWTATKWAEAEQIWMDVQTALGETVFSGEWWGQKWTDVMAWTGQKWMEAEQIWEEVKTSLSNTIFSGEWWAQKWTDVNTWASNKWAEAQIIWDGVQTAIGATVFSIVWWQAQWEDVKQWTATKWAEAQVTWDAIKESINETIFSGEWWKDRWGDVTGWASEQWEAASEIWEQVKKGIGDTLFSKDWWGEKWGGVVEWTKTALSGIGSWVSNLVQDVKDSFTEGRESGKKDASKPKAASNHQPRPVMQRGSLPTPIEYANGGLINRPHLGLVGEAGPEAIIPLSAQRRSRALDLYEQTGRQLGVRPYANGGIVGGSVKTPSSEPATASLSVGSISVQGMDKEAQQYGHSFSQAVAQGINNNVVSIDAWKQNNIQTPMQSVVGEAVGFGASTVSSFASGQNAASTNTAAHLNTQVTQPFQVIQGGAASWGTNTVAGFRSGQDATSTETRPYLVTNVDTPFNETKAKGPGWGSGIMTEFISGMRSQEGQVRSAAKYLAEAVEKTFREELGIASPSRVMMKNGMWTAMGIVKGLDSVDLKGFAEKQIDAMMAGFAGGAAPGDVSKWLTAAMMLTGTPMSWLGPLSVIAMKESGGNPFAQNNWDINAKRGIPSKGLMQTIGPTFNAHKVSGLNNIFNPIHNAAAAINYIKSRYGNVFNVPGIRSMAAGGAYRGYWRGTTGTLNQTETAWVGEKGPELVTLPRGAQVHSHNESKRIANETLSDSRVEAVKSSGGTRSTTGQKASITVQVNFNGDNYYSDEMDAEKVGKIAVDAVRKELETEYFEGGEVVVDD